MFKASNLRGTLNKIVKRNVATLVDVIGQHADQKKSLNMWDTYGRFTFDVACDMTFGRNMSAQL